MTLLKPKRCRDCGINFEGSPTAKMCPECRKIRYALFWEYVHLRRSFADLAQVSPDEARLLSEQMEAEEGKEFREDALDGILENVSEGRPYTRKWKKKEVKKDEADGREKDNLGHRDEDRPAVEGDE